MTYDLTRKGWIPVRWLDGCDGSEAVGLRDALERAHEIAEVVAPRPLETAALYRLLQALFVRLHVNPLEGEIGRGDAGWTNEAWFSLWNAGRLDPTRVDAYFRRWHDDRPEPDRRFDLLHPIRPFYGHPSPERPNTGPLSWLFPEHAKGNNDTLFDHTTDAANLPLRPAEAARALLALHAYRLGGIYRGGDPVAYKDGPLAAGIVFWIRSRSLFEALLLNTPPAEHARMPSPPEDAPAWERDLPGDESRAETGYLDYLTWQSRHVRLIAEEADLEGLRVTDVHLCPGPKWVSERRDPLMAHVSGARGGWLLRLEKDVALWREAPVWLGLRLKGERAGSPPATFDWLANPPRALRPEQGLKWDVDAFGLARKSGQEKLYVLRQERLAVHPSVLASRERQEAVEAAVRAAHARAGRLRTAIWLCAVHLVAGVTKKTKRGQTLGEAVRDYKTFSRQGDPSNRQGDTVIKQIVAVERGLDAQSRYWSRIETGFLHAAEPEPGFAAWLDGLARLEGEDGSEALAEAIQTHLSRWTRALHRAALQAYDEATRDLVGSPRRMEAVAVGRHRLRSTARRPAAPLAPVTP
jgi:CRISPR system Cascade subunit CasA